MLSSRWIPIVVCGSLFVACSSGKTNPGPPPPCPACMSAGALMVDPASTGTGAGGATGTGSGQGGETVTATGDVVRVDSTAFDSSIPYTNPGTVYVYAYGTSGQELSAPYTGTKFSIDNVSAGESWFLVLPKDTTDNVFPTYSVQNVGANKLELPLIDTQVLNAVAAGAFLQLSDQDAQIVIRVSHNGKPLDGIKAETMNGLGAGEIVYDFGAGNYSKQAGMTGNLGVIVLLNMTATSITLTDTATMTTYHPVVRPDPGTATLLDLEL